MAESSQNIKAVRESSAYRTSALTFRRLGERLRLVSKGHKSNDDLVKVIETEVLPRLMLIHRQGDEIDAAADIAQPVVTDRIVEDFVDTLIGCGCEAGNELIIDLVASGASLEDIFLKLMAPAARRMGERWTSDDLDFVDVTIGLCRLHELLRNNSVADEPMNRLPSSRQPSILLSVMPGDQHVFGVQIAAEFFRRDGWQVACETGLDLDGLARILSQNDFDVLGLSLANEIKAAELTKNIDSLRKASSNQNLKVILGGSLMGQNSEFVRPTGADLVSADAATAPRAARALLAIAAVSV
ncbi:MAG: cobalamin-dependent protein [Pseudomonadota bacterium]